MNDIQEKFQKYKLLNPNKLAENELRVLELKINKMNLALLEKSYDDDCIDFYLYLKGYPSRQEIFAKYIYDNKLRGKTGIKKILEVGAGKHARVGKFLSEKGFFVTCIDPKLTTISQKNLICIAQKFDYHKFDISDYDYIIAQEPCEGAEQVVRACIKANKPFTETLCGQPHKLISKKRVKNGEEWHRELKRLHPLITIEYIHLYPIHSNMLSPLLEFDPNKKRAFF